MYILILPGASPLTAPLSHALATLGHTLAPAATPIDPDMVIVLDPGSPPAANAVVERFAGRTSRLVVASSAEIYQPSTAPLSESSPLRTDAPDYAIEQTFLEEAHRLPVTLLRVPATYGPHDPRHTFFPYVKRFADDRPAILLEPSHGTYRQSLAYVDNAAHAFALAAGDKTRGNAIYNLSEPKTPTVGERLHDLARLAKYKGPIIVVPRDRCPAHLLGPDTFGQDLILSDAALRQTLGFQEVVPTDEALRRTLEWQRLHAPDMVDPRAFDYAAEDAFLRSVGMLRR